MQRNQVWLWGHPAGAHDRYTGGGRSSSVSPGEACRILGLRNLVMVALHGAPVPPFAPHAGQLLDVDRLVWSVVDDGTPPRDDLEAVLELARSRPNVVGGIIDNTRRASGREIRRIAERLHTAPRRLDLWGVVYTNELQRDGLALLESCDVVTLWSHESTDLGRQEHGIERFCALAGGRRRLLGVYLWDFPGNRPVPDASLERNLERGATWIRAGMLEGIVLLASSLVGMGLASEGIARRWISTLG